MKIYRHIRARLISRPALDYFLNSRLIASKAVTRMCREEGKGERGRMCMQRGNDKVNCQVDNLQCVSAAAAAAATAVQCNETTTTTTATVVSKVSG